MTEVKLTLQPGRSSPLGRGLVRVPLDQMEALGLQAGDVTSVSGVRTTHARVMPAPRGGSQVEASADIVQNTGGIWGGEASFARAQLPRLNMVLLKSTGTQAAASA